MTTSARGRQEQSFYDAIGGYPTIAKIVDRFYEGVATDEVLRPLYPEEDLAAAAERFTMFLVQYWGGPSTYSERRGHPRLRMRHAPFAVTPRAKDHWLTHFRAGLDAAELPPDLDQQARDRWLTHFRAALDSVGLTPEQDAQFWAYVTHAATFMINTPG